MAERQAGEAAVGSQQLEPGVGALDLEATLVDEVVAVRADQQGVTDTLLMCPHAKRSDIRPNQPGP